MSKIAQFSAAVLFSLSAMLPFASASELNAFHRDVRSAFAHYRGALFYLRTGNDATGALELDLFREKWTELHERWRMAPPDAFADDPQWQKTLTSIDASLRAGLKAMETSSTKAAREELLPIRWMLHELRRRNGIYTFSDCIEEMNRKMLEIWRYRRNPPNFNDLNQVNALKGKVAVYEYLIGKCRSGAPARYGGNQEFNRLFDGAENSVRTLWDATDKGQRRRFINILRELRPFDRLIFLRFG